MSIFGFSGQPTKGAVKAFERWQSREERFRRGTGITCWVLTVMALGFVYKTANLDTIHVLALLAAALISGFSLVMCFGSVPDWEEFERISERLK
jgi:hypothetical protein